MTNLDPKHLDALVERQRQIAILHRGIIESHKDAIRGPVSLSEAEYSELIADASRAADTITALRAENDRLSNLWQIEHDHATALRAQIDRDRAAAWCDGRDAAATAAFGARPLSISQLEAIGALTPPPGPHTDATRAAMDAIQKEQGPFPASWWGEDDGDVLWWCWRDGEWLSEAPYVGTPLDLGYTVELRARDAQHKIHRMNVGGWPGYHTHWTRLQAMPPAPKSFA